MIVTYASLNFKIVNFFIVVISALKKKQKLERQKILFGLKNRYIS